MPTLDPTLIVFGLGVGVLIGLTGVGSGSLMTPLLVIVLGVYPKPVIDIINPAVHQTLVQVHSRDPVPAHPASALKNGSNP